MNDDDNALEIAARIADGSAIDWPATADTRAGDTIDELKAIAALATLHRSPMDSLIDPEADVRRWGPLTILDPIGEGRFGQVFRAWDARLHRQVALKVLHAPAPEASASPSHAIDEARLLARVRHPNVLTIYGAEAIDGQVGIWTEFIEGRTLEEVLAERGPLPPEEVAAIGVILCRALTAVHDSGLLHRDIKAQNVMRETGGRIVLMDFGTGHDLDVVTPPAGDMSGTPLYLAPEIFAGDPATAGSDIYALAVLLHRLLTGRYPVEGRTLDDVRAEHVAGRRTDLNQTQTALTAAIERGLSVDPALRFQSAADMEQALLENAVAGGPSTTPHGPPPRYRALRVAGFIGIAASLVLAAWWAAQPTVSPGTTSRDRTLTFLTNGFSRPAPDGRFIAHVRDGDVWLWDARTQRDVRQVTQRAPNSMEGAEGGVAISFDGTQVAHVWTTADGARSLRIIRVNGTNPTTILLDDAEIPEPIEWSRDGRSILTLLTRPGGRLDLALVPTTPGTPVVLQTLAGRRPKVSLSPDGQYVVYDAPPTADRLRRHLMIVRTDGSPARVLLAEAADADAPFWTPDGRHVLFVSTRSGPRIGWLLPVTDGRAVGEPVIAMRTDMTDADPIALTKDGQYFYRISLSREVFIRETDAASRERPPSRVPAPVINGHGSPGWSPDGRRLAFVSGDSAGEQMVTIATLSTGAHVEVPLLLSEVGRFGASLPQWTPDAQFITIRGRNDAGQRGYFNVDVKTGDPTPVVVFDAERSEGDYGRFRWMPDGRFVYQDRERGLIARTPAGEETILFPGPKLVSPVDFSIASAGPVAGEPMNAVVIHTAGGSAREVLRVPSTERIELHAWSADGRELILTTHPVPAAGANLAQITAKLLKLRIAEATLVDTGLRLPVTLGWAVAVSPDGRRVAYEQLPGAVLAELHVAQGFLPSAVR